MKIVIPDDYNFYLRILVINEAEMINDIFIIGLCYIHIFLLHMNG